MLENLNNSKKVKVTTYVCLAFISLFIVATFAQYYSKKLMLQNPLIPEELKEMVVNPYLKKGFVMLVTTLGVLILQTFKKHFFALLVALGIIIFFLLSKHYIGGWHAELS
jgi:hypothetical protein